MPSDQSTRTFDYVKYDETAIAKQERCKELCQALEEKIHGLGAGHYQQLATDHLEICYMMIGKAIRDDQIRRQPKTPHQPERGE